MKNKLCRITLLDYYKMKRIYTVKTDIKLNMSIDYSLLSKMLALFNTF